MEQSEPTKQDVETPVAGQPASEFDNFKRLLKQVLSVKKSDIDVHKPVRPRKAKRA